MVNYKKAWNRFKKQITKDGDPLKLKGCMYMTDQQIGNRTATIDLGSASTDDDRIAAMNKASVIINSDACNQLDDEICIRSINYEIRDNAYYHKHMYMRINYGKVGA